MMNMSKEEFHRAVSMWGIALCVFAAAAGWIFMRFGQAWSIGDLPESLDTSYIVPAYMVTEVMMIPVAGKLADIIGIRKLLLLGPLVYVIGSMLCILSPSVGILVLARLIQGIGGGIILGIAFTAVGKFYDPVKRGKCHELMTAAFAIGSLFGTAIGYFLTDNFNWRFPFLFFGGVTLIGMIVGLGLLPKDEVAEGKVDTLGMILLAAIFGLAGLFTQRVNVEYDLISWNTLVSVFAIAVMSYALIRISKRSSDPVIPMNTTGFEKRLIILMFLFSLCGLGLIQYFFKLYLSYYEFDIYKASLMFGLLILGAAGPSMLGCRKVFSTGIRPWVTVGAICVTASMIVIHFIADKGQIQFGLCMALFGFGLGCIVTEILCSMQCVVEKRSMGCHTGFLMAIRMVGILVGNAIVGAYIRDVVHTNYVQPSIDLNTTSDVLSDLLNAFGSFIGYSASSMVDGLLTSVIIMAVVTFILIFVCYKMRKDDIEALNADVPDEGTEEN